MIIRQSITLRICVNFTKKTSNVTFSFTFRYNPVFCERRLWSCINIYYSGVKTFVNEFAAYDELGKLIDNKFTFYNWTENYNRNWSYTGDLDITFYPGGIFNTTDVLPYGYIEVSTYVCVCFDIF